MLLVLSVLLLLLLYLVNGSHSLAATSTITSFVTGANGYVGRAVVQELLLQKGDDTDIVCLVRPQRVSAEKEYWKKQQQQQQQETTNIQVLPYDMLDNGASLELALESSKATHYSSPRHVYHIASVFGPTEDHKQTALDNVQGTEDLVRTLGKVGNCKLILTSSMAAVRATGQQPLNGKFYTNQDWNTLSELGANWGASYQWSKAESERRAWALSKECNVPMVSLCPSFVFGPPAGTSSSFSLSLVGQWTRGESPVQSRLFVDVRDVAQAHVEAASRDTAKDNRYIVSTEVRIPSQEIAEWLKDVCRRTNLSDPEKIYYDAEFAGGSIPIGEKEVAATQRLDDDLGITLRPVKDTIIDMATVLLEQQIQHSGK